MFAEDFIYIDKDYGPLPNRLIRRHGEWRKYVWHYARWKFEKVVEDDVADFIWRRSGLVARVYRDDTERAGIAPVTQLACSEPVI